MSVCLRHLKNINAFVCEGGEFTHEHMGLCTCSVGMNKSNPNSLPLNIPLLGTRALNPSYETLKFCYHGY